MHYLLATFEWVNRKYVQKVIVLSTKCISLSYVAKISKEIEVVRIISL